MFALIFLVGKNMSLVPFTKNYADNSTEAGFQFTFFCDVCRDGYKTKFTESKARKKAGFLRGLGAAASIAASVTGRGYGAGYGVERGTDVLSERFQGMSPEWHKEHEQAFQLAQNEAMGHFHKCPKCNMWVCETCWNEEEGLCVDDAPRVAAEVAAARAKAMKEQIWAKAAETKVFTGEITARETICPQCGKPAGLGKFCVNCGAPLTMVKCPRCGAQNAAGVRFCGECGNRLA